MTLRFIHDLNEDNKFETVKQALFYSDNVAAVTDARIELEGVEFILGISDNGQKIEVAATPDTVEIFIEYNTRLWTERVIKAALQHDVFGPFPKGSRRNEVLLYDDTKPHKDQAWNCPPVIYIDGQRFEDKGE